MKIKFYTLLFGILMNCALLFAQAPTIQWDKTIGGSGTDLFTSIKQTSDGGYILAGYSDSYKSFDKSDDAYGGNDYWVVKVDASGKIEWDKTIGGSDDDYLYNVEQTTDGGYILGGMSRSGNTGDKTDISRGGGDYWIVKIDSSGNIQWQKTIGGSGDDVIGYSGIKQTSDGGYILGGYSNSPISGDKTENCKAGSYDYWVVKIDDSGAIQWQNTIGGTDDDILLSVAQTSDGGYILGGYSASNIGSDKTENSRGYDDYWLVKINSTGVVQWDKTIGGTGDDMLWSVVQTTDGGYLLGGMSSSPVSGEKSDSCFGSYDCWIVKTDSSGNIEWDKTFGSVDYEELHQVMQTSEGGYILSAQSAGGISGNKTVASNGLTDYWLIKTNAEGDILWQKAIGGDKGDYRDFIDITSDGGYIVGGSSSSDISGDKSQAALLTGYMDYWVVKLSSDPTGVAKELSAPAGNSVLIYPNPSNGKFTIRGSMETNFSIIDELGQVIQNVKLNFANNYTCQISSLQCGMYFIQGIGNNVCVNKKIIIVK